jgi:hypothetical protein
MHAFQSARDDPAAGSLAADGMPVKNVVNALAFNSMMINKPSMTFACMIY